MLTSDAAACAGDDLSTPGLRGHLHLVCGVDSRGESSIRQQSFRAPMHLSKPYTDAGVLVVNVVNPTAGLLAGDRIDVSVAVENGARLLLSTPSANRAHTMPSGRAVAEQSFSIACGASLENWPELFIPQTGARYVQSSTIHVEDGGELMFWELLAPGRVASGEVFRFAELDWKSHVYHGGRLVLRERYRIVPGEPSVDALRYSFPEGYYASGIIFSPALAGNSPVWSAIHQLHSTDIWIGCSALQSAGWTVRLLCSDSVSLRRALKEIRRLLYDDLGRPMPSLRRAGS